MTMRPSLSQLLTMQSRIQSVRNSLQYVNVSYHSIL